MTVTEISNEFDILVDSYRRFKDFDDRENLDSVEFNEYEKSIFLTKAQQELIKQLYSGKYTSDSFEKTEDVRRYLEPLVKQVKYTDSIQSTNTLSDKFIHTAYKLPDDCWYIVLEQVQWSTDSNCINGLDVEVLPVTHDTYTRTRKNPFRGPNNSRVLRLDNAESQVELVSNNNIGVYTVKYLAAPEPIVLAELSDESIDGVNTPQSSKLPESPHHEIVDMAVRMALTSKGSNSQSNSKKS